jgi:cytochrome P450
VSTIPVAVGRLPVLGHLLPLARDPMGFLQAVRAQGDVVVFHLGPRPVYQVNSAELIREVLVTRAHEFRRGEVFAQARRVLGDGLATADGGVHMRQRRTVQPAFHPDRLAAYLTVICEQIDAAAGSWVPHRRLRLDRELAQLTVAVTAKALFRADLGRAAVHEVRRSLAPVLNGIVRRAAIPVEWLNRLPTPGNRRFAVALGRLRTVVDDLVDAYRRDGTDHGDLLSMLIAAEAGDDEVRTQVLHLLMAGTDTTATTLSWVFYELARHPDVAARVRQELGTVLGGRAVTGPDLAELRYLDRVLTETIRLHTPVWLLVRRAATAVRLGDVTLPPGAQVLINLPTLHRDPDLFPDPLRFDPDRWLRPPSDLEQRARFIPFGAGAHKCVGADFAWAEMKAAVALISTRWRLDLDPHHRVREIPRAFLRPSTLPMIPR